MPSKKVREPNTYSVELSVDAASTRELCALLVCELVKYLQYSRGQAHQQAQTAGAKKKQRPPSGVRKALKYTQSLQALLSAIQQLPFEQLAGAPVVIIFGPTPRRPSEVYRVFLPPCTETSYTNGHGPVPGGHEPGANTAGGSKSSTANNTAKRMLRTLVLQHGTITEWDGQPGATKMFILFQAPPAAQPLANFLPRRSFTLALKRKAFQVDICINVKASCFGAPDIHPLQRLDKDSPASPGGLPQEQLGMHGTDDHDADADLLWHQCCVVLKGLRLSNSS